MRRRREVKLQPFPFAINVYHCFSLSRFDFLIAIVLPSVSRYMAYARIREFFQSFGSSI